MGTAGTVGGTAQVKDGLGNGLTVETGTGGSPHTVSGAKGAGIRGSLGNGGGVADTIVGGEGVVKATAGTSDGTVKIGKVGGTVAPLTSIGFSGQGPVALPGGPGGPVVPGPGPLPPKPIPDTDLDEVEVDSPVITQQGAKVVQKPAFELTPSLQHRHVKGMVEVRVEVDADNAATVTLKKSSGDTELDDAVVHYIQSWKWQAAKQDGASIKSGRIIRFRVN
jgi:TonB family protein